MEKSCYNKVHFLGKNRRKKKIKHESLEIPVYHNSVNSSWTALFYLCKPISM